MGRPWRRYSAAVVLLMVIGFISWRACCSWHGFTEPSLAERPIAAAAPIVTPAAAPAVASALGPALGSASARAPAGDALLELARFDQAGLGRAVLAIARESAERSVRGETVLSSSEIAELLRVHGAPDGAADLFARRSAGVVVTVVRNNSVRACVGSIWPQCGALWDEIAKSATDVAARDFRHPPIRPEELESCQYAISFVGRLERVQRGQAWDPATWGVFVRSGSRTGLILPREARTHAKQVSWALSEAGIPSDAPFEMYRFRTVKYGCSLAVR
ncbi:MAG: AMMECR1 domain-containing protein [Clostridia bacterium]|nr:AMMECR1 domain-containing protein [Clostridia bacterium]